MRARVPDLALTLAYTVGGGGGSTAAIRRLNLLTSAGSGVPLDALVLTLANGGLLRDLLRPFATAALGLTPGGFVPGIPFAWFGAVPLAVPGGLPTGVSSIVLNSLVAGIDDTGLLRLIGSVTVSGSGELFTFTASANQVFAFGATPSSGDLGSKCVGTRRLGRRPCCSGEQRQQCRREGHTGHR